MPGPSQSSATLRDAVTLGTCLLGSLLVGRSAWQHFGNFWQKQAELVQPQKWKGPYDQERLTWAWRIWTSDLFRVNEGPGKPLTCDFFVAMPKRDLWVIGQMRSRPRGRLRHPFDLRSCSLRGLDSNQRPLGYESCISRSAQAYPLLTRGVRSAEIKSLGFRKPRWSTRSNVLPEAFGSRGRRSTSWVSQLERPLKHD